MLTFAGSEEKQGTCFKFIGANNTSTTSVRLISNNVSLISDNTALISSNDSGLDTCSFYNGPSDAAIVAFGESYESCGSIAFAGSESCGSIAYSGAGESCGSVATSVSSGSSFSGGCSYCC